MEILKKNGVFNLSFTKTKSAVLERKTDFRLRDVLLIGTAYYQVVKIHDEYNSPLKNGEKKYILELISPDKLIENAYSLTKF